jgi:phosphoglycolate phosphatase-like HAD superfamily hydrolase
MRHVIWDWNGTLVDDLPIVVEAVNASLSAVGGPPIDADAYRDDYTRPVRLFYDRLLGHPVTDSEWHQIDDVFHCTYADAAHRVALTDDARDAIVAVATAGGSQSILSMWWHEQLVPQVTRHGLDEFMVRVDGNIKDAGETKERLLALHLDRLQSGNRGAVMIGDALDDARASIRLGLPCVLYDGGSHHRGELESSGVPVAASLLEAVDIALSSG